MPHTLQDSADLTGSGVWVTTGDVGDFMYVHVTTRGAMVVEMDPNAPPRLFQAGWLAIANEIPDGTHDNYFQEPLWIVFDKMLVNMHARDVGENADEGYTGIRYELLGGTEIHVEIYKFS